MNLKYQNNIQNNKYDLRNPNNSYNQKLNRIKKSKQYPIQYIVLDIVSNILGEQYYS